jgi:hypothetical protein
MTEVKWKSAPKRYHCPKCGRLVRARQVEDAQEKIDEKMRLQKRIQRRAEMEIVEREKKLEKDRLDGRETGSTGWTISG